MPKARDVVGDWTLERVLGEGGNAVVWEGVKDGESAAIKVLKLPTASEGYDRFAQEVRVHLEILDGVSGVLPLLEADLPTGDSIDSPPWLAMPVADPLVSHVPIGTAPSVVVGHIISIGTTLAALSDQFGISHRDIKPENLYWTDQAVVGDFGLVEVPGGADLSRGNRDLGPRDLLAPEMRAGSPYRQGPPADVFSLGLTAFRLMAGEAPRDGLRSEEPSHRLVDRFEEPSLAALDRILQRATAYRPEQRPTMSELVDELVAWISPPLLGAGVLDPARFRQRVSALTPIGSESETRAKRAQLLNELQQRIYDRAISTFSALQQLGLEPGPSNVRIFDRVATDGMGIPMGSFVTLQPAGGDGAVWVAAGAAHVATEVGPVPVLACWTIASFDARPFVAWTQKIEVSLDSERSLQSVDVLLDQWSSYADDAVDQFLDEADRFRNGVTASAGGIDSSPPELLDLQMNVRRLDDGSSEIVVAARLRDLSSGVAGSGYTSSPSQIRFQGPNGEMKDVMFNADSDRMSGTRFDGWFEGSCRIETFHAPGDWVVEHVLVADQAGHCRYVNRSELDDDGLPSKVVIGSSD